MRLVNFQKSDRIEFGVEKDKHVRSLKPAGYASDAEFFEDGETALDAARALLVNRNITARADRVESIQVANIEMPSAPRPRKIKRDTNRIRRTSMGILEERPEND